MKTPIYSLKASTAYKERLKEKGWVQYCFWIPAPLKKQLKAKRDELIAEYKAAHPEEN